MIADLGGTDEKFLAGNLGGFFSYKKRGFFVHQSQRS